MRTPRVGLLTLLPLAALLALAPGCNKSEPAAQSDWVIDVTANPATIELSGDTTAQGETLIVATVFDTNGNVQSGIGVRFSTSGGSLESSGTLIKTDARGEARDRLFTREDAKVKVKSGSAEGEVDVKTNVGTPNEPPTAVLEISPRSQSRRERPVQFSCSGSTDPDGEVTGCDWVINSSNPDSDKTEPYLKHTNPTAFNETWHNTQHLSVKLTVTDDKGATNTNVDGYDIIANLAPKADAGPDTNGRKGSGQTYTCSVTLSFCGSTDPDGKIIAYEADWGEGGATPPLSNCQQQHTYFAAGSYTVTLRVYDNGVGDGDGDGDPNNPTDPCNQILPSQNGCPDALSATDTATVTCPP